MSIITVSNLSKKYIIGHDRQAAGAFRYKSLRDSLTHLGRSAYQRLRHPLSPNRENTDLEEFWALKDVNFEINQGASRDNYIYPLTTIRNTHGNPDHVVP